MTDEEYLKNQLVILFEEFEQVRRDTGDVKYYIGAQNQLARFISQRLLDDTVLFQRAFEVLESENP